MNTMSVCVCVCVCDLYMTSAPLKGVCFLCVIPTSDWLAFVVSLSAEQWLCFVTVRQTKYCSASKKC